jgi:hypothetical protein
MTGIARISAALREIGVLGAGQTASGANAAVALELLVDMMNEWAADSLTSHAQLRTVKALTSGTRDYTIGPTGDINIARPMGILRAGWIRDSTVDEPKETPIDVYTDQQWAGIRLKTHAASVLNGVYYDKAFSSSGRGTVSTYPTIDIDNVELVLYTHLAVVGPSDLASDLSFPPAYSRAIRLNLARELCGPMGRPLPEHLTGPNNAADGAKAVIRLANHKPVELTLDPSVPGMDRSGSMNWGGDTDWLVDGWADF